MIFRPLHFCLVSFLALLISACSEPNGSNSSLLLTRHTKDAYEFFKNKDHGEFFAVSIAGSEWGSSYGNLPKTLPSNSEALTRCRFWAKTDCVIFANAKGIVWSGTYEWETKPDEYHVRILTCRHVNADGTVRDYTGFRKCEANDVAKSMYDLEYDTRPISRPVGLDRDSLKIWFKDILDWDICDTLKFSNPLRVAEAKRRNLTAIKCSKILTSARPSESEIRANTLMRERSDHDICNALKFGNPDYAKEAERRGLTAQSC